MFVVFWDINLFTFLLFSCRCDISVMKECISAGNKRDEMKDGFLMNWIVVDEFHLKREHF